MAPERLNIEIPTNNTADGTCLPLNCDHRVAERGRTKKQYPRG